MLNHLFLFTLFASPFIAWAATYFIMRGKRTKVEYRYIDRAGVSETPPSYIETERNCVLNIKIDDDCVLTCAHLPVMDTLRFISTITARAKAVEKLIADEELTEEKIAAINTIEAMNARTVWRLCEPYTEKKKRKQTMKAFYTRYMGDAQFARDVVETIWDYWGLLKKKAVAQALGQTIRQIFGVHARWGAYQLTDGVIVPKPPTAFGLSKSRKKQSEIT